MQGSTGYKNIMPAVQRQVSRVNSSSRERMSKTVLVSPKGQTFNFSTTTTTPTDDGPGKLNDNELIEYVEGKVFEVLKSAAKCKHEKLARTASFEDLGFDSLDGVELILAMEENFGFDITNTEAEKITSVMDAIQIFHENVLKRQSVTS